MMTADEAREALIEGLTIASTLCRKRAVLNESFGSDATTPDDQVVLLAKGQEGREAADAIDEVIAKLMAEGAER